MVYFLDFGWIEDNDEPNIGVTVDGDGDINKTVGTMDGGEFGRSCGDINTMVGVMGGEVGRSYGDINKTVGTMD